MGGDAMNEEEYRAEMAKQARLANLIAIRALITESVSFAASFDSGVRSSLNVEIRTLAMER